MAIRATGLSRSRKSYQCDIRSKRDAYLLSSSVGHSHPSQWNPCRINQIWIWNLSSDINAIREAISEQSRRRAFVSEPPRVPARLRGRGERIDWEKRTVPINSSLSVAINLCANLWGSMKHANRRLHPRMHSCTRKSRIYTDVRPAPAPSCPSYALLRIPSDRALLDCPRGYNSSRRSRLPMESRWCWVNRP